MAVWDMGRNAFLWFCRSGCLYCSFTKAEELAVNHRDCISIVYSF